MSHTLWRKFDALSARWTSPDPYSGSMELASPQTLNRYTYVNNDPVNKVDPSGLMLSDIGVAQTTNRGAALRLERAGVTVLRRYMEGQTNKAQQRQTATQRANAAFTGGMSASATERYAGFFEQAVAPQNPESLPVDVDGVRAGLAKYLSNPECTNFISDLLGRVASASNPLVAGGDLLDVFDVVRGQRGIVRDNSVGGGEARGSVGGRDGGAQLVLAPTRFGGNPTASQKTVIQLRFDIHTGLHETIHFAGLNVYSDRDLAVGVAAMMGTQAPGSTGRGALADAFANSAFWDKELRKHCK